MDMSCVMSILIPCLNAIHQQRSPVTSLSVQPVAVRVLVMSHGAEPDMLPTVLAALYSPEPTQWASRWQLLNLLCVDQSQGITWSALPHIAPGFTKKRGDRFTLAVTSTVLFVLQYHSL